MSEISKRAVPNYERADWKFFTAKNKRACTLIRISRVLHCVVIHDGNFPLTRSPRWSNSQKTGESETFASMFDVLSYEVHTICVQTFKPWSR